MATSLASISAKKLSEGLFISLMMRAIGGESTLASTSRPRGAVPRGRLAACTAIPRASSASSSRAAANAGGLRLERAAALGREPAVVGQRAQRPDPDRHAVARVGPAAQRVVARLVAVDAAGDALDAGLVDQLGELLDRGAAAVELAREGAASRRWGRRRRAGRGCRARRRSSSSWPSPSTSVPSVPSVPKRASAAAEVNSFVFEARMRGVPARQANTCLPALRFIHVGARARCRPAACSASASS